MLPLRIGDHLLQALRISAELPPLDTRMKFSSTSSAVFVGFTKTRQTNSLRSMRAGGEMKIAEDREAVSARHVLEPPHDLAVRVPVARLRVNHK